VEEILKFKIKDLLVTIEAGLCRASQQALSQIYLCRSSQMICTDDIPEADLAKLKAQLEEVLDRL
jgi:hypothetical protein